MQIEREYPVFFLNLARSDFATAGAAAFVRGEVENKDMEVVGRKEVQLMEFTGWWRYADLNRGVSDRDNILEAVL